MICGLGIGENKFDSYLNFVGEMRPNVQRLFLCLVVSAEISCVFSHALLACQHKTSYWRETRSQNNKYSTLASQNWRQVTLWQTGADDKSLAWTLWKVFSKAWLDRSVFMTDCTQYFICPVDQAPMASGSQITITSKSLFLNFHGKKGEQ